MILPARFALMVAFAVMAGKPASAAAAAVQQPATVSEIGQFFDWRHGRAFWFASDNEAYASSPVARDEAHQHRRTARAQPAPAWATDSATGTAAVLLRIIGLTSVHDVWTSGGIGGSPEPVVRLRRNRR